MPTQLCWPALQTGTLCCTERMQLLAPLIVVCLHSHVVGRDHKPHVPTEQQRILSNGGFVCTEGLLNGDRLCAGSPLRGSPLVPALLPAAPVHRCVQPPAPCSGGWRPPSGNARQQTPEQQNTTHQRQQRGKKAPMVWRRVPAIWQPATLRMCAAYTIYLTRYHTQCKADTVLCAHAKGPHWISSTAHTHVCARHVRLPHTPAQQLQQPRVRPRAQLLLMRPCLLHPALLLSRLLLPAQRPAAVPAAAAPALPHWPVLQRPALPRLVFAA